MRQFLLRLLQVALFGLGLWLIGAGIANADTTDGTKGAGSGNQLNPTINAPITACGNDISVLGKSKASCHIVNPAPQGATNKTSGRGGVLSGNQVNPTINAPVTACGNAVGVLGRASARCASGHSGGATPSHNTTSGKGGVLSGNQINPTINAPVTVCGNAGGGHASASCAVKGSGSSAPTNNSTSGRGGVLSGNQVNPNVNAPVTVCGNAVAVVGRASAHCVSGHSGGAAPSHNVTSGKGGVLSGNQVNPNVNAPVTVCGNAVAVVGRASAHCVSGHSGGAAPSHNVTSGKGGVLSGNQVNPNVNAPVTVCGNAVAVVGRASAHCVSGHSGSGAPSHNVTSGKGGVLSGNQVNPNVNAPVTVCGNAVAVIGRASAHCVSGGSGAAPSHNVTSGKGGVLSGNQVNPDVNAPVTVCGNAVAVVGRASARCVAAGNGGVPGHNQTGGQGGVGSGNQVNPDVNAPVTVCGNAVAVVGRASASCIAGGSVPPPGNPPGTPGNPPGTPGNPPGTSGGPAPGAGNGSPGAPQAQGSVAPRSGELASTGGEQAALAALALLLLLLGGGAMALSRRPVG